MSTVLPLSKTSDHRQSKFAGATTILTGFSINASGTPAAFEQKFKQITDKINLNETCIVFVDVLRATTTINAVLAVGCLGVQFLPRPSSRIYDMSPEHEEIGGVWLVGGEENGAPIVGGVIGNSPITVDPKVFRNKFLRFYSTNGSQALKQATTAPVPAGIFLASLANTEVTVDAILAGGFRRVFVICGGFYQNYTIEDTVAAGRIIGRLAQKTKGGFNFDDEARVMKMVAEGYGFSDERLISELLEGQVAKILERVGRLEDVRACITGEGIDTLWRAMVCTAVTVKYHGSTPLLVSLVPGRSDDEYIK